MLSCKWGGAKLWAGRCGFKAAGHECGTAFRRPLSSCCHTVVGIDGAGDLR